MKFTSSASANVGRTLLRRGPSTATDLADELHLSGAAIRKHLDALLDADLIESSELAPYGPAALKGPRGRGRPAKVFSLTPQGRAVFGEHEDSLALTAVKFLSTVAGQQGVRAFAEKLAADFATRHPDIVQQTSVQERTSALATALDSEGFAVTVSPGPGNSTQICQHNCPVSDIASEFQDICDAETEAFSQLTGVHVTRLATIAQGHAVCTTLVPHPRRDTA